MKLETLLKNKKKLIVKKCFYLEVFKINEFVITWIKQGYNDEI